MSYKIEDIEGIGPAYGEKLQTAGIKKVEELLENAAGRAGRKKLAEQTGIDESRILTWVNHADLFRVKGIGPQFAELLEAAGVDTVKEFRTRNADNLLAKMEEVNASKNLVNRLPSIDQLKEMIEEAKGIEPKVSY